MAHLISHEECYLCEGDGRSLSASVALFVPCILCKGTGWGLQLHGNEERTAFQNIIIEYGPADVDTYLSPEEIESLLKQGLSEAFLPLQTTSHTGEERQLNPDLFTQEEENAYFDFRSAEEREQAAQSKAELELHYRTGGN